MAETSEKATDSGFTNDDFLTTSGQNLVKRKGEKIQIKGVNLGARMIQLWKGNYLVSNGAEVGIYARDAKEIDSYYDCATDEQMMEMSMELYHGDDLIFFVSQAVSLVAYGIPH